MTRAALLVMFLVSSCTVARTQHDHPAPERLGMVSFPTTCKAEVAGEFNRAVALLHSFAYGAADAAFQHVAQQNPACAMAHWGSAMTHYHQLWDLPPSPPDTAAGTREIEAAAALQGSERERGYILALREVFGASVAGAYGEKAARYEAGMQRLATAYPDDVEARIFYALALVSNASPTDKEHRRQKRAVAILEPLFHSNPEHPGVAHYLIHACDNQELAQRGLPAARVYAGVAPSAPHALHMPSHIFTRLGQWDDSITSNLAARDTARKDGDTGEELHAMDYLVYAYLQRGDDTQAVAVLQQLHGMGTLNMAAFKIGYAATAMPVRYVVERQKWEEAEKLADPPSGAAPHVVAITVWARGLGFARTGNAAAADREAARLLSLRDALRAAGNGYWAAQVDILRREVMAWSAQAAHQPAQAVTLLRSAADDEDGVEKLPVTPGPIVPAREQLGELLLVQGNAAEASKQFQIALANAPGRRGASGGAARANQNLKAVGVL